MLKPYLFETEMAKLDTLFMTKMAKNPYSLGPHIDKGVSPWKRSSSRMVCRDRSFSEVRQVRMKVIQCYDHAEPEQMDTF